MITKTDLTWWLELEPELDWQFATTYATSAPHEYVIADRTPGVTQRDLARAAHVIRTFGRPLKFFKETRIYLETPSGWKHWDMQGPHIIDEKVSLINRGRSAHQYGVQNAPDTASGIDSAYDRVATRWAREHGPTAQERAATARLIRQVFGERLGRTLDVGCGTGLPLDFELTPPAHYVGVDPSTGMLNALVAKHPHTAGLHPVTWRQAVQRRVLGGTRFDTVLALGGAASYLNQNDIIALHSRAKRSMLLVHYLIGEAPVTGDLDPDAAWESLQFASGLPGAEHTFSGRFVATSVPARAERRAHPDA